MRRAPPSPTRGEGEVERDGADSDSPSPLVGEGLGRGGSARDKARALRKSSTETEKHLWRLLRAKRLIGWKFRRQYPIGPYIADFVCPTGRLIVEADGSQHLDNAHDTRRDAWLTREGWHILRFWNNDIFTNEEGVLSAIIGALPPLPNSSPTRGEGLHGVSHA